jgi:adenylate kinase
LGRIIAITGSPGTGKKSIAPLVASALKLTCHSLNELAASNGAISEGEDGPEVDTIALRRALAGKVREPSVVYGHLVPQAFGSRSVSRAVVLRCEPSVLKARLTARGYPPAKVNQNVEAELIGLVSAEAYDAFGVEKTAEFDTSATTAKGAAKAILGLLREKPASYPRIDWTLRYDSASRLSSLLSPVRTG